MKQRFHISRCCCGSTPITKIGRTIGHNVFYHTQGCSFEPDGQGGFFPPSEWGSELSPNGTAQGTLDFGWTRNITATDINMNSYEAGGYRGPRFYDTPVIFELRDGIPDPVGSVDDSVTLPLTVNSAVLNFRVFWYGYTASTTAGFYVLQQPYTFRIKGLWYTDTPAIDLPTFDTDGQTTCAAEPLDSSRNPWEYPDGSQDIIAPGPSQPQRLTSSLAEFTIDNSSFPAADPNDPLDIYQNPLDISVDITSVYQEAMAGNTQPNGQRNLMLWMYGVTPFPNPPALYQGNTSFVATRPHFRIEWRQAEPYPTLVTT